MPNYETIITVLLHTLALRRGPATWHAQTHLRGNDATAIDRRASVVAQRWIRNSLAGETAAARARVCLVVDQGVSFSDAAVPRLFLGVR
jgi:hypothetical protein